MADGDSIDDDDDDSDRIVAAAVAAVVGDDGVELVAVDVVVEFVAAVAAADS
jgi:hypothetical protein